MCIHKSILQERTDQNMFLPWLTGGIAALDLFIKDEIEREGAEEFPRDFPGTKGFIRIHKSYNPGFPFGFMKERPQLVKGIPLAVTSAAAGALAALFTKKGCVAQKIGLSMVLGGAISNLYDRLVKGYVVDYFSIEFKRLKNVIFNLGDIFVFLGSLVFLAAELLEDMKD